MRVSTHLLHICTFVVWTPLMACPQLRFVQMEEVHHWWEVGEVVLEVTVQLGGGLMGPGTGSVVWHQAH